MTATTQAISDFWQLFEKRADELAAAGEADSPAYDALLEQLRAVAPGLHIEFSTYDRPFEFIITAEGERALFDSARAVAAAAPVVSGWTIRALKPKLGFPVEVRWRDLVLRPADIVFDPLEREGSSELGLRILIPGLREEEREDAHNAMLRALDHALGEEAFAKSVQHTEVSPLPPNADPDDFIPLEHLDSFIRWRDRRLRGGGS
jgi:hypothetical protein